MKTAGTYIRSRIRVGNPRNCSLARTAGGGCQAHYLPGFLTPPSNSGPHCPSGRSPEILHPRIASLSDLEAKMHLARRKLLRNQNSGCSTRLNKGEHGTSFLTEMRNPAILMVCSIGEPLVRLGCLRRSHDQKGKSKTRMGEPEE